LLRAIAVGAVVGGTNELLRTAEGITELLCAIATERTAEMLRTVTMGEPLREPMSCPVSSPSRGPLKELGLLGSKIAPQSSTSASVAERQDSSTTSARVAGKERVAGTQGSSTSHPLHVCEGCWEAR
jgi:hypothetical protein